MSECPVGVSGPRCQWATLSVGQLDGAGILHWAHQCVQIAEPAPSLAASAICLRLSLACSKGTCGASLRSCRRDTLSLILGALKHFQARSGMSHCEASEKLNAPYVFDLGAVRTNSQRSSTLFLAGRASMPAGATPCVGHGEKRTPFLRGESLAAPAKRQRAGAASARRSGAGVFGERFGAMPLAERSQESCYKGCN